MKTLERMLAIRHIKTGEVFATDFYFDNGNKLQATSYDHVLQRYNELSEIIKRQGGILETNVKLEDFTLGTVIRNYVFTSEIEESFNAID